MTLPTCCLIDNIRMMAGKEVQTFVASKSQILAAVDSFYGHKNLLDEVRTRDRVGQRCGCYRHR